MAHGLDCRFDKGLWHDLADDLIARKERGGSEPAPNESTAEPFASACLPALDRADWPAQPPGGLFMSETLEIAQDQYCSQSLGEPLQLLVHRCFYIVTHAVDDQLRPLRRPMALVETPSRRIGSSAGRHSQAHRVKPWSERVAHPKSATFMNQDEEDRLEGVLRGMLVAQARAAGTQHHRAMAFDQSRKRQLSPSPTLGEIPVQQLSVRCAGDRFAAIDCAQLREDTAVPLERHDSGVSARFLIVLHNATTKRGGSNFFEILLENCVSATVACTENPPEH
jgi:hypothetical protein